ncbi:proteasome assembly chaperone 3-like [Vespula maculifrons]|uniref:Proteasome assembly chaperone 3-like n=1 Tax=Vespula maculifrons TaxID=7453 RepID=A0ABD2CED8_VESMC
MSHIFAINTCGYHTDIAVTIYSNRIFIIISHFKKLGSLITVNRESALSQFNSNIFSTNVIFGKDEIDVHAAARYIAEQINIDKPLLLSISLKDYNKEILKVITDSINQLKLW